MSNDKDFKVKNGIQPTVYQEGLGTIATGSVTVGYTDASLWAYSSKSYSVTSQETDPAGFAFKSDGTKMYLIGRTNDTVYQYSLSTAWDVSTSSYDSVSFLASSQTTNPACLIFKPDGTKMYILDYGNDDLFQYSLSTAWDVSTASYDSVLFDPSGQETTPRDFKFNADGTKIFLIGSTSDAVHQYSLSTAYDVGTASYDSVSFSATGQTTFPGGLDFNSDASKMYIFNYYNGIMLQYSLPSAYDIANAVYDSVSFTVTQDTSFSRFRFSDDGVSLYVAGTGNDTIYQYSTGSTLTTNTLDLSTGNAFQITPTSDIQVGLSNPAASGTVSQATLLLGAEDPTGVSSAFSTTLYTGTGSTQTITNGIDLAGDGGMVWIKSRTSARYPTIVDTERGPSGGGLFTSENFVADASTNYVSQFNSDGFQVETYAATNESGQDLVSWAFKKQDSFFDVVTYTGNNTARTISHDLGCDVGMIIIKCTETTDDWVVYHRKLDATNPEDYRITLNGNFSRESGLQRWNSTPPTSTEFSLGTEDQVNDTGKTFIAYVFAHDTSATSAIKCGSYTGNGSSTGPEIDLGFEPQWLLIKKSTGSFQSWAMYDTKRGIVSGGDDALLFADTNSDELGSYASLSVTSTGFKLDATHDWVNTSGETYVYMAIANPSASTITYDSSIQFGGGTAPDSPLANETDVLTFSTRDGGTSYQAMQAIDGAK